MLAMLMDTVSHHFDVLFGIGLLGLVMTILEIFDIQRKRIESLKARLVSKEEDENACFIMFQSPEEDEDACFIMEQSPEEDWDWVDEIILPNGGLCMLTIASTESSGQVAEAVLRLQRAVRRWLQRLRINNLPEKTQDTLSFLAALHEGANEALASRSKQEIEDIMHKCETLQKLWVEACEQKSEDEKGIAFLIIDLASMSQTEIGNLCIALQHENNALRGAISRIQLQGIESMKSFEIIRNENEKRLLRLEYARKLQNIRQEEELELQKQKQAIRAAFCNIEFQGELRAELRAELQAELQASLRPKKMRKFQIRFPWKSWFRNVQSQAREPQRGSSAVSMLDICFSASSAVSSLSQSAGSGWGSVAEVNGSYHKYDPVQNESFSSVFSSNSADLGW